MASYSEILDAVIESLTALSGNWEYDGQITAETRLIGDMAMKSLDIVVLSSAMVRRFGLIPFDVLYARMEDMPPEDKDIAVGEFVSFIEANQPEQPAVASGTPSSRASV